MSAPLLVVGSVNYDLIFRNDLLPRAGETVVGAEFTESCGGKGANQAIAAARFGRAAGIEGLEVIFSGAVGDDAFGERQLAQLREDGVSCEHVVVRGNATGLSTIWVDDHGENRILNAPGANLSLTPETVASVPIEDSALLLVQNEIPSATLAAVVERAAAADVPVIWDPAPFAPGAALPLRADRCWLVTPNETEAESLLGRAVSDASRFEDARALQAMGFAGVLLTRGRHGVVVAPAAGEPWEEAALAVEAVDSTAAGDAFSGAAAASLVAGQSLTDAVRSAVRYAGAAVCRAGAQTSFPTRLDNGL
ncbi:MAG: ribokinase [Acidobacteriota bacterium]|nr:ribokinase [Acidobacteriota bacterium]